MAQQNGTVERKNIGCTMIYKMGKRKVQMEDKGFVWIKLIIAETEN